MSPARNGVQCGSLPAASGSFAPNDHNGGATVVGLCLKISFIEAGTAGISLNVTRFCFGLPSHVTFS